MAGKDFRAQNRRQLVEYYRDGCKPAGSLPCVGVEVEHFIVQDGTLAPVFYEPHDGMPGVRDVLEHLAAAYPQQTRNGRGDLLGLASDQASITLEPAAQLEISIAPYERVGEVRAVYDAFRAQLDPWLSERGLHVETVGYHPSARAQDLPLIPKERYRLMDAHFERLGTHGMRMMRATCSTQVSVDYISEADAVRKLRVASALAPILAAICDNMPVFEGRPNGERLTRMGVVWRDVDDARCGCIPGIFAPGWGFEALADWMLGMPPIFVTRPSAADPDGPAVRPFGETPAAIAYADAPMTRDDVEHLLSMAWPDVRCKRFVEIRPADCMPPDRVMAYAALVKGLFYSEDALAAVERRLGVRDGMWPLDDGSSARATRAIRAHGDEAVVHGTTLAKWKRKLRKRAAAALPSDEAALLDALFE